MCPEFHVQKKGTYYYIMIPYAKQTVNLASPTPTPQKRDRAWKKKRE